MGRTGFLWPSQCAGSGDKYGGTATATDAVPLYVMLDSQPPPRGEHCPSDAFGAESWQVTSE